MARVATYLRVSTNKDQTVENQRLALAEWAQGRGHSIVAEFVDEGISGAKGRDKRPGLDSMLRAAVAGKFDMLAVTELSRLGRSCNTSSRYSTSYKPCVWICSCSVRPSTHPPRSGACSSGCWVCSPSTNATCWASAHAKVSPAHVAKVSDLAAVRSPSIARARSRHCSLSERRSIGFTASRA